MNHENWSKTHTANAYSTDNLLYSNWGIRNLKSKHNTTEVGINMHFCLWIPLWLRKKQLRNAQNKIKCAFFFFFISFLLIQFAFSKIEVRKTIHVIFRVTFICCFCFFEKFFYFSFQSSQNIYSFQKIASGNWSYYFIFWMKEKSNRLLLEAATQRCS